MTGASATPRRHAPALAAVTLLGGSLAVAALTLLAPSSPSYDPFAWIVWGRELMPGAGGPPFGLAGGPSWKPLPVLFTTPLSLAGGAAPGLWLLVARAGLLLALAGAYALAARLAARVVADATNAHCLRHVAGATALVALALLAGLVSLAWRGASEPLLLAAVLWAGERHLAGARRTAFALGVAAALIRPEAAPFLALYALLLWRGAAARERRLLAAGLALLALLWIGVPALAGDPFAAATTAANPGGRASTRPGWSTLRSGLGLAPALVWALALAAVALRPRDRVLRTIALAAAGWLALVAAMAVAGYAGVARYMLPAAAAACALAGVAAALLASPLAERLAARRRLPTGRAAALVGPLVLAIAAAALAIPRLGTLDDQLREGTAVARVQGELRTVLARAGGSAALGACALRGWVAVNHTMQTALAWELRVGLDRVARTMSRPGLLVRADRGAATGAPAPLALGPGAHGTTVAAAGAWTVLAIRRAGSPLPPVCRRL